MAKGYYKCECGREFTDPQSFNGHKGHCSIHHQSKLSAQDFIQWQQEEQERQQLKRLQGHTASLLQGQLRRQEALSLWISEQHICERCGKVMTEMYGSGRFCSASCARSHSHSKGSREKTSAACKATIAARMTAGELRSEVGTSTQQRRHLRALAAYQEHPVYCVICHVALPYEKRTRQTCCPACTRELDRQRQKELVQAGLHKGWMRRSQISYAEHYWMEVLNNHHLKYVHDFPVPTCNTHYLLDFKIGDSIDVEIDGKQHLRDYHIQHDMVRDERLRAMGYMVYRIPWINPGRNPDAVQQQIADFFEWLRAHGFTDFD